MSQIDPARFPRRTVHLDFHTGPEVPGVGEHFDAGSFAATFQRAHVDSVTVFAKCHHGHLYHDTERPERHPSLPADLDLLAEQVDALHAVGIRAPIYLSVQCDEWAAREHPEWVACDEDLRAVRWGGSAYTAGWHIMDMSSPYQDFLADQLDEVLRRFAPVDGIFMDMCWDQTSSSRWANDGMRRAGLDPVDPRDRQRYARSTALGYMERYRDMVEKALPADAAQGVWFNSRPKTNLHEEGRLLRHVEIEGLPTGGWGYAYLPYVARFVRPLGLPTLSHTGRFHESWGDNGAIKPRAALMYECCQILSQGLTNGVGDLLHPRGVPSPHVYDVIGSVYAHVERCEPFVADGVPQAELAVVVDPALGDAPGPSGIGAVRVLQQLRVQFDVVPPDADLERYGIVLVPETTTVDSVLAAALQRLRAAGRTVVLVGDALLGEDGSPSLPDLPVRVTGPSSWSAPFLRREGHFDTVAHGPGLEAYANPGAEVLAHVVAPYFERSWARFSGHSYTPPDAVTEQVAVAVGAGVVAVTFPLLKAFAQHGNEPYRELLGEALSRCLPRPLVRVGGPTHLETTVVRTPSATVVHLLSFVPARETPTMDLVHDAFPLVDVPVEVRAAAEPSSVHLQPDGTALAWQYEDGYVRTRVTVLDGHAMVVVDD
ncbi:MAG TPA: alpha-L-fucosidase [Actinomycetales bacterium]